MIYLEKALKNFKPVVVKHTTNENGNLEIIQEFINPKDFVKLENNNINFQIQDGLISEVGVNGIQASDLIRYSLELIKALNESFPCRENSITITKLEEAINAQNIRTIDRINRNVESSFNN